MPSECVREKSQVKARGLCWARRIGPCVCKQIQKSEIGKQEEKENKGKEKDNGINHFNNLNHNTFLLRTRACT